MSRATDRQGMPQATRLSLVERDLDSMEEGMRALDQRLGNLGKILVGMLVSVTTACILLAVNVIVIGSRT